MLKLSKILIIISFLSYPTLIFGQKSWQGISSASDLCSVYPEFVEQLFEQVDLTRPGMELVRKFHQDGREAEACRELLTYYSKSNRGSEFKKLLSEADRSTVSAADTILKDVFTIQNARGQLPVLADGHRDWYYKGPNQDEEWAWLSNRHSQVLEVLQAYFQTGNKEYISYLDSFLKDFIISSLPYPAKKSRTSVWRGLEVAARIKVWTRVFYGLIGDEGLSPATKLLILCSLPVHAHYNRYFHRQNNWLTMEISALATVAAYFLEYKASEEWLDYAILTMTRSIKKQVYTDGVQTELTAHYHRVALENFSLFQTICERAGKSLPAFYLETMQKRYQYLAFVIRPDGYRPLNNDVDRGYDRDYVLSGAKHFDKPELEYVISIKTMI